MNQVHTKFWRPWVVRRRSFVLGLAALGLAMGSVKLAAQGVVLSWNPLNGYDIVDYVVYYGTDGSHLSNSVDASSNTSCTVQGLQPGSTNYFEVEAYDSYHDQSLPSPLLQYVVPGAQTPVDAGLPVSALPPSQGATGGKFSLLVTGHGTVTPDARGQSFRLGDKYVLRATADKGSVFADWVSNGVVISTSPTCTGIADPNVVLEANFVLNPFGSVAGTYYGLFSPPGGAALDNTGSFVATVTSSGAYSARIRLGSESYSCSGGFNVAGAAAKSIVRPKSSPITMSFQLGWNKEPITGTIGEGTWTADLVANPAVYSKTNPAPATGSYTMIIPGSDYFSILPGGNGYGVAKVDTAGNVSFVGTLADGTRVSSSTTVCEQGQWPFYASLYGNKGSVLGWLTVSSDFISGHAAWFKLPEETDKLYPAGFATGGEVLGSVYHYTKGRPVLDFIAGQLTLTGGNLTRTLTDPVLLEQPVAASAASAHVADVTGVTFQTASGLFMGSVLNPATGKPLDFSGVVLQGQNIGAGLFTGATETGGVLLLPAR